MRRIALSVATVALLGLTSCSALVTQRATSPTPTPTPTASDCLQINDASLAKLQDGIRETVRGATFLGSGVAKSPGNDVWYIAVKLHDPGLSSDLVGVWGALQDPAGHADVAFVSIDDVAKASSPFLQPTQFANGSGVLLDGAKRATRCIT